MYKETKRPEFELPRKAIIAIICAAAVVLFLLLSLSMFADARKSKNNV